MNSGQICCQGEYTAKVCDYGSKCCLDDIGRLVGCEVKVKNAVLDKYVR